MEEGLVALRARHLEPGVGFGERGLDFSRRLTAPGLTESAHPGEQSRELPEPGAEPAADGDRFFRERQGLRAITEAEMRCGHPPECAPFHDRSRRSLPIVSAVLQSFERILPCAVQDVREPEVEVGEDSPILTARAFGVAHRLPAVRQGRRCLARDLTAKDVEGCARTRAGAVAETCARVRSPGRARLRPRQDAP